MVQLIKTTRKTIKIKNLKEFANTRNKILLMCHPCGLGDYFMLRMIFKSFKQTIKNCHLTIAINYKYYEIFKDHPFVDDIIDHLKIDQNEFGQIYDVSVNLAGRYEKYHAPCTEHRSDIWCRHYGVTIDDHDMQFNLNEKELLKWKKFYEQNSSLPVLLFAPISKMQTKSLMEKHIRWIVEEVKKQKDIQIYGIHHLPIPELEKFGINTITGSYYDFIHMVAAADYIISVDTAAFHLAGGLKKKLMGIFTYADGKAYGKHFNFTLVQKHRDHGNWDCGPCFTFAMCPKSIANLKPCLLELTKDEFIQGIKCLFCS
jgi:ADP-heptose:LPS heptosyltransferase